MATKFITRIFSAIENQEDAILNQIENDVDIALEDNELDTEQYSIHKLSDNSVRIHDKVNNEDTIATKSDIELEFSEPVTEEESENLPLDIEVSWIDESGNERYGKLSELNGDLATVILSDTNEPVSIARTEIRLLDDSKSFASAIYKDDKLIATIGGYDIAFDFKRKLAYNVDDERQMWQFNGNTKFIDLYNKIAKELGAKTFSKKFNIKQKSKKFNIK